MYASQVSLAGEGGQKQEAYAVSEFIFLLGNDHVFNYEKVRKGRGRQGSRVLGQILGKQEAAPVREGGQQGRGRRRS